MRAATQAERAVEFPRTSSWFVAVPASANPEEDSGARQRHGERRSPQRLLNEAADASTRRSRAWFFGVAAVAVALMFGLEGFQDSAGSWAGFACAMLVTGGCGAALFSLRWHGVSRDSRRERRLVAGVVLVMLCPLALLPWLTQTDAVGDVVEMHGIVLSSVALVGAGLLAPRRGLALAAAGLPLSAAIASLANPRAAPWLAVACVFASVATTLVAVVQHRRWALDVRTARAQDARIRDLASERDAAIKADQEKSRFLAIASHDLRQPVHAIGLFAATLEKRLEGAAEQPLVRNLNRAIDGLDQSFNAMLDISRLDAGAVDPRVQHFKLRDLFRRLHMHFAGQADLKGLGLRFSPGGKSVTSDPQLLERVLGNLVQNAIRNTESGGIVVVARTTESHINIEVWDSGIGIAAPDLRKVFDEYYQVGGGQRVRSQGLGMGLAIVKRLVRLLGHELIVASRPGRGTMFRLRIALGGLREIEQVTAAADTLPMPALQPRTVLVLDDEEPIRDGLCMLLREWGYEAIGAESIEQAQRAVRLLEAPPDLILSDLHLGDGPDGIAGIETIRRECGCDVPAMLITGDTTHAEIRRATDSGHPVLFKPVRPRKLYDALRGLSA